MDLFSSAWMTRSLGEAVSALYLEQDAGLFAGGWNGCVKSWDSDGELQWTAKLSDRVTVLQREGDVLFATAGLHVACIDISDGSVRWNHALEGSADSITVFEDSLYAVSSVYDIEHNDFLESAVWNFSFDGELRWIHRMDERPWVTLKHDGDVWFGLGRPKCGFANIRGEHEFIHTPTEADSPITCGSETESEMVFGHANGSVSNQKGDTVSDEKGGIEHIVAMAGGYVAALENGCIVARMKGENTWSTEGGLVSRLAVGFEIEKNPTLWSGRWSGSEGILSIQDVVSGKILASTSSSRCESISVDATRTAIGCEDGSIHVWEKDMLNRRMKANEQTIPKDNRKSALQEKLRALRDR